MYEDNSILNTGLLFYLIFIFIILTNFLHLYALIFYILIVLKVFLNIVLFHFKVFPRENNEKYYILQLKFFYLLFSFYSSCYLASQSLAGLLRLRIYILVRLKHFQCIICASSLLLYFGLKSSYLLILFRQKIDLINLLVLVSPSFRF